LHIGPHKTGTTYLQHAFDRLRAQLAIRGICYPEIWGGPQGHQGLADQIQGGNDAAAHSEFARLNQSTCDTILLSSETFSYFTDEEVRRLQTLLDGQPATVIFYCRRWSELIPSGWREMLKHGWLETLPDYALSCLGDPAASRLVNFDLALSRYAAAFGAENLRIVSYNGVLEAGEDLATHFCRSFVNWPEVPPTGFGRVNVSLDLVDSEVLRALNALHWARTRQADATLYHRYMAAKDRLPVQWLIDHGMQFTVNRVRINDAAPGLAQMHDEIACRYRTALVTPAPGGRLFAPGTQDVLHIRTDYLLAPGVLDRLSGMLDTLLSQD
jgi:hypothetical protein